MFVINEDNSIYATRGDIVFFYVTADNNGENHKFQPGDVLRMKVYGKKDAENVVLQKDFPVEHVTERVEIYLSKEDTKFGEVISKPRDYWYEIELNPFDMAQTILGYGDDGPCVFRLMPEGDDVEETPVTPEDIPIVDAVLDMTSTRPVQNQAIARAYQALLAGYEATAEAVSKLHVTPQMFGAIGDGEADDTKAIQDALNSKRKVYLPNGVYKVKAPLTGYNDITFDKDAYIEFYPDATNETCIKVSGSLTRLADNLACTTNGQTMAVSAVPEGLEVGDYVYLSNDELAAPTGRSFDTKRDIVQVQAIENGVITFVSAPEYSYTSVNVDKMNTVNNIVIDGVKIRCMKKFGNSCGITLEYARNATVRNCHISNFDYGQINFNFCVLCDAHSNLCEVDYADELQYGMVIHSCANITVYGNKVNSRRTAIDVTRLSNKVTVNGNTTTGSINTHSCTNTAITNNTINDGMILIRGKNTIVTGNSVQCHDAPCIDMEEMGIEGGHIISNNIFKGYCSMKCYLSNISITNNHFIVEKVLSYGEGAYESVIRLMTAGSPNKTEGAVICGNVFEAVGITPIYCVEANLNMRIIYNLVVQDNMIRGFKNGLYLPQMSGTPGDNLIVKNNMMFVTETGITFRLVNNTQIVGNTVIGTEKGTGGIVRHAIADGDTYGLVIRDNFVKNFQYGLRVNGGANMNNAVCMDNIFQDCDTKTSGVSGNTNRVGNELFAMSISGKIFYLRLTDDGVLTPTAMDYT